MCPLGCDLCSNSVFSRTDWWALTHMVASPEYSMISGSIGVLIDVQMQTKGRFCIAMTPLLSSKRVVKPITMAKYPPYCHDHETTNCAHIMAIKYCWFHIYPKKAGFVSILCSLMMRTNNRVHYGPMVVVVRWHFIPSQYHHYADESHWRHWTSNMLARYILLSLCLRFSQFSQLPFKQYMRLCIFSLPLFIVIIVWICIPYLIIIVKLEVWTITIV